MKKIKIDKRLVFLLVLLVVAGTFLIYTKSTFTGLVVLDEYENQTSCETAGYTWEGTINETCVDISNCTECGDCEETCEECVDIIIGQECSNLTYTNETDCIAAGYTWDDIIDGQNCTTILNCTECEIGCQESCQNCTEVIIDGKCTGAVCGDGITDEGEECDDGENNGDYNNCAIDCLGYAPFCGDDNCDSIEDCNDCPSDCGECTSEDGGEGEEVPSTTVITTNTVQGETCVSNMQCGEWQECVEGTQIRICTDSNECNPGEMASTESRPCEIVIEETCFDGIQNQDEQGIDCGGSCEKKCSFLTMVGSAVSGPIDAGKKFVLEGMFGNIPRTIISIIILVFLIGGAITLVILSKKKIISLKEISTLPKLLAQKANGIFTHNPFKSEN